MEEQEEILQRSDDSLSTDSVAAGTRSAAVSDDWRRLLVNLLVLAVTIPALLRCSGGGDLLLVSWSLSLFAVSYLFYCTCLLSTTDTQLAKIFTTLFYAGLLAFFARGNVLGMVIMYLDSVLAAGLFGATLAQHRQSNGTDTATLVAVANARANHKKPECRRPAYVFLGFIITFCCSPPLVWLMLADGAAADVAGSLLGAIGFCQFIQITFYVGWLNGANSNSEVPILLYFACVFLLYFCSYLLMGEIVGFTVLWLCILASTTFLGYYYQVHASYEKIMSIELPCCDPTTPLEEIIVVS